MFADDLVAVLDKLDIQGVTLIGFSKGGGEFGRYLSRRGAKRFEERAVLISSVVPYLLKDRSNPER